MPAGHREPGRHPHQDLPGRPKRGVRDTRSGSPITRFRAHALSTERRKGSALEPGVPGHALGMLLWPSEAVCAMVRLMGIEVLVVQHGEKVRAAGDPGLTETGLRQATAVAAWLQKNSAEVSSVWSSPLKRAQQTAAPIAAAFGLAVQTDGRLRERMNWDDESEISLEAFLADWQRASEDRTYQPAVGDSSSAAAERFVAALVDIARTTREGVVVVVAHGGVTVDSLRALAGDASVNDAGFDLIDNGVPCGAITELRVDGGVVSVDAYPSTGHLDETSQHRPV